MAQSTGSIGGTQLGSVSAVASQGDLSGGSAPGVGVEIDLVNQSFTCGDMANPTLTRNETDLSILVYATDANMNAINPTETGDYPLEDDSVATPANGKLSLVTFGSTDASCGLHSSQATSGTVHITKLDKTGAGDIEGTFDMMFGSDHVTGAFHAPYCTTRGTTMPTCH